MFDIDISVCPLCGGTLRVIADVTDPDVIQTILAHLQQRAQKWFGFPEQLSAIVKCIGCGLRVVHGASAAHKRLRARSVGNPVFMLPSMFV